MRAKAVDQYQKERHNNFAAQFFDAPDILDGLDEFLHWKMFNPVTGLNTPPLNNGNYLMISTVPPAASIMDLAFSLTAFTLKFTLAVIAPFPRIFTLSVRLIRLLT